MEKTQFIMIASDELEVLLEKAINSALDKVLPQLLSDFFSKDISYKLSEMPELLTRKQASELLRVSLSTIDKYMRIGRLSKKKIGGKVLIEKAEIIKGWNELKSDKTYLY